MCRSYTEVACRGCGHSIFVDENEWGTNSRITGKSVVYTAYGICSYCGREVRLIRQYNIADPGTQIMEATA